jgi:hypothetical protein
MARPERAAGRRAVVSRWLATARQAKFLRATDEAQPLQMLGRPEGLLRDKTRPSRISKLDAAIAERIVALTTEPPSRASSPR